MSARDLYRLLDSYDVDLTKYEVRISESGVRWDPDAISVECLRHRRMPLGVAYGYTLTPMEILEGILRHEQERHDHH